jgi:DinB superfamily
MDDLIVRQTLLGQYRAAIEMLGQAVELCPEELWLSSEYHNRFWHIAYHSAFYVHFYVQPSEAEFKPWAKHKPNSNFLGPWAKDIPFELPAPYSKTEVQEYLEFCRNEVEKQIPLVRFEAGSGFSWLPFDKFELQLYTIRHLQHHTGQLVDRLRNIVGLGVRWVGRR